MKDTEDLWSVIPVPALVIDQQNGIMRANPAAEAFLNQSQSGLRGVNFSDCAEFEIDLLDLFMRVRGSGMPVTASDINVHLPSARNIPCTLNVSEVSSGRGYLHVLMNPKDGMSEIAVRNSTRNAARTAIGMAEMLAHEIKNPLAGISGAAQLLAMNLTEPDIELTDLILKETKRIVQLLEQVEQFGNLLPPKREPVNVHDVLDQARRSAALGFATHMQFVEDFDPSLPMTDADINQLVQVILNLLKNASEAQKGSGTIWLRTFYDIALRVVDPSGHRRALPLQIEICDDGPGIPESISEMVFDPFVSGKENGTGLGLALVAKIIADHGGWVSVKSKPGSTIFKISLPLSDIQNERMAG